MVKILVEATKPTVCINQITGLVTLQNIKHTVICKGLLNAELTCNLYANNGYMVVVHEVT